MSLISIEGHILIYLPLYHKYCKVLCSPAITRAGLYHTRSCSKMRCYTIPVPRSSEIPLTKVISIRI